MAILRDAIRPVGLPEQLVQVDAIGGEVRLRGLDLPAFLEFNALRRRLFKPRDGETDEDAAERAGGFLTPWLLHRTVWADDGAPVYSEHEWGVFALRHPGTTAELAHLAMRLSGGDGEGEKKS